MSDEPNVYECSTCGRLWVYDRRDGYDPVDAGMVSNANAHVTRECMLPEGGYTQQVTTCHGYVYPVQRPEVLSVYLLSGKQAAINMADGALAKSLDQYEHQQLRELLRRRKR